MDIGTRIFRYLAVAATVALSSAVAASNTVVLLVPGDVKTAHLAAEEFATLWEKVADERPAMVTSLPEKGDVVVFGEEQMNPFTQRLREI